LKETILEKNNKKIEINPFKTIFKYLLSFNIKYWIISFLIAILAASMYQVMLPIFLNKEYEVSGQMS
jgi:hypothetical protein